MGESLIILPETRISRPKMNCVPLQMRMYGQARCVLRDKLGNVLQDTGWFPNLVLDRYGELIRDGGVGGSVNFDYCELGSSNTAPANTDVNVIASLGTRNVRSTVETGWGGAGGTEYVYRRKMTRFLEGQNTGNVREMAWHGTSTGNSYCYIRALIVDSGGSPTTIVKGADHILDVWHEMRNYPPTGDATGSIDIYHDGVPESFDYTVRPVRLTMGGTLGWQAPGAIEDISTTSTHSAASPDGLVASTTDLTNMVFLTGLGNAVTTTSKGVGSTSPNWWLQGQIQAGLDSWLITGGIRTVRFDTGNCTWQVQYSKTSDGTKIQKTNEDRLRLNFHLSWDRYTP